MSVMPVYILVRNMVPELGRSVAEDEFVRILSNETRIGQLER